MFIWKKQKKIGFFFKKKNFAFENQKIWFWVPGKYLFG
jgi:hypothetical protein